MVPNHILQEIMNDRRFSTDLAFSSEAFTNARMKVRNPPHGPHASVNKICADHLLPDSPEGDRWFHERHFLLHLVADLGDVLLAYEYLRLGLDADVKDLYGRTPIWFALQAAARLRSTSNITAQERSDRLACQTRVARLLIERQHIDVNQSLNDVTPLELACKSQDWELISLPLEHGAKQTFTSKECFSDVADRKKFMDLVATKSLPWKRAPCSRMSLLVRQNSSRMPRHPRSLPLFLCICASKKTHENCCARKAPAYEYWDGTHIAPYTKYNADKPEGYQRMGRAMQSLFLGKFTYHPDG